MAELSPDIAADVLAACNAGAEEAAEALSRALDAKLKLEIGESGTWNAEEPPEGFEGPGLVVVLQVGDGAALVAVPESSGLLPAWYAKPDPTGQSKLDTLAQELGMLLLPEALMPEQFSAGRVADLRQAMADAELAASGGLIPLACSAEDHSGTAFLVWPAVQPGNVLATQDDSPAAEEPASDEAAAAPSPVEPPSQPAPADEQGPSFEILPTYTRSLLRVSVPITVTLATKKETLGKIVEISPGTIIQFNKSCDELLSLEVGGQKCAEGEAVKVGDKFGLRITSIVLPSERFVPMRTGRRNGKAG